MITYDNIIDVFNLALDNGVSIALDGEDLAIKVKKGQKIDRDLLNLIKESKSEIIDFLQSDQGNLNSINQVVPKIYPFDKMMVDRIPLSFTQEGLWFIDRLTGSTHYHISLVQAFSEQLNVEALSSALKALVDRHEIFRTLLQEDEQGAFQNIIPAENWQMEFVKTSDNTEDFNLQEDLAAFTSFPFDLSQDYVFRARLYEVKGKGYVLNMVVHHIAFDGWSVSVLMNDLLELYYAALNNRLPDLPELFVQYSDYTLWQKEYLSKGVLENKMDYWKNKLEGVSRLELPLDYNRPDLLSYKGDRVNVNFGSDLSKGLNQVCQQEEVTLFMLLQTAIKVLFSRYSGQADICMGGSMANRSQKELEHLIGFFVNTVVLRSDLSGNPAFNDLLAQVKQTTLEAYQHQDTPFDKVVDLVQEERALNRHPLVQVMLVLQNASSNSIHGEADERLNNLLTSTSKFDLAQSDESYQISKFDITFTILEGNDGISLQVEYATDLFNRNTIEQLSIHLQELLRSVVAAPTKKINQLNFLNQKELSTLAQGSKWLDVKYPEQQTVVDLFTEQVIQNPDNVAVTFEGLALSYAELDLRSNQLAHYLRLQGVQSESLVGICVNRGLDMIIGILGIIKAGGVYIPMDPDYPTERIKYILEDSNCSWIVSNSKHNHLFENETSKVIHLDTANDEIANCPNQPLLFDLSPNNALYVIYTSGSTGKPKGVVIEHRNVIRLFKTEKELFDFNASDVWTLFHSFCFDFSVWEMYGALLFGGKLVIASKDTVKDPSAFCALLETEKVTVLNQTPSAFYSLQEYLIPDYNLNELRYVIFGGEALSPDRLGAWNEKNPQCSLINMYGITETTVHVTYKEITSKEISAGISNIGQPIPTLECYVLDEYQNKLPIGQMGEIYVGGAGLARTYLNRPELTAERFIPHPFSTKPGARLYKTGDLACWLENGELEYLGRRDDQVKIRAHRIELGEIESVLESCDLVRQSVVLAKDDPMGSKRLIAYIIPQDDFDRAGIQTYLNDQLPKYMIPALLMQVDHFPLTVNGKLHKALLPEPSFAELLSDGYIKPRTKLEASLAAIWEELLGVNQVGAKDDFFELGGHSLLATRVVARIRQTLNIKLGAQDLFLCPTIEELAERIGETEEAPETPGITAISKQQDRIPLSYAQERLWFIDKLRGTTNYHIPVIQSFNEKIDLNALEKALSKIVQRHEVLRTTILEEAGDSYQNLLPAQGWKLTIEQLDPSQKLEDSIRQDMQMPFDLSKDYMMRAKVYQISPTQTTLLIVVHHIASDGWSLNIMINELLDFYHAEAEGRSLEVKPLDIQYADYALWQRANLSGEVLEEKLNYWENKLKGLDHLTLPLDFKRPNVQSSRGRSHKAIVPQGLSSAIKKMAKEEGVTPFMFLLAGFKLLLNRYSNQTDICVGSSIANREQKELEGLIGFFVNLITLRSNLEGNPSFKTLLKQVKQTTLDAYAHQDTPFEKVVDRIIEERDQSRSPLFQVSFVLQNSPDEIELKASTEALLTEAIPQKQEEQDTTTLFDLAMNVFEVGDTYKLELVYCADLFKADTIERMVGHYQNLLDFIVENADAGINEYPLLSDSEKQTLDQFNQTEQSYPDTQSVAGIFSEQAIKTPNNVALVDEQGSMTYAELEAKSNQLAHHLTKTGVKAGSLVGICMDRNNEMIIALLGILKSGAAYVPIDASYPQERISFMVDHSGLEYILCSGTNLLSLMEVQGPQLVLVETESEIFNEEPTIAISTVINSEDKAYLMYTSGSTGMPKGVLIKHQSILRLLFSDTFDYLNNQTVIYHYAPLSFDASTFEIWGALLKGGQLVLPSTGQKSLEQIESDLNNYKVNTLWLTAGLFHLAAELHPTLFAPVKYLLSGGDSIHLSAVSKVLEQNEGLTFINGYGPTECTTFAVMRRVDHPDSLASGANIIGTPIGNTKAYILNPNGLDLVPLGCPGELCLSGPGLAIGYLKDDDLNGEKFIPNPYGSEAYDRLYRTGDLARWQADGTIEFLGRKDNQVKIRGFRIELGEVERVLDTCEMVVQNTVIVSEDGNGQKVLVAYIISEGTFDRKSIQAYLKTQLPDYMIPSVMLAVEAFPLTENGKVDRKALPEVDLTDLIETDFVAPQTPLQSQLAEIWKTLLKVEQIGIYDNFFDLGGHSLLAIRLLAEIRETLGLEVKITDIFEHSTIDTLSAYIGDGATAMSQLPAITKVENPGRIPLSYTQEGLWFIDQLTGSTHYHVSFVQGLSPQLNIPALEKALKALVERHAILHTVLKEDGEERFQEFLPANDWKMDYVDCSENEEHSDLQKSILAYANKPFDLSNDYIFRAKLYKIGTKGYCLGLVIHHIASDGWSTGILMSNLLELYNANVNDRTPDLEPLSIQYSDYALWQRKHLSGKVLEEKLGYWENKLQGVSDLELPQDFNRPDILTNRGELVKVKLDEKLSTGLYELCKSQNVTLFMVLQSALKILFHRYSGQTDICMGASMANRSQKELESLIGFFVNTVVLRSDLSNDPEFINLLTQVKQTTLEAYQHQDTPFDSVVERVVVERKVNRHPLVQAMLVLQNASGTLDNKSEETNLDEIQIPITELGLAQSEDTHKISKFDICFTILENNGSVEMLIEYATDLFKHSTIEGFGLHFETLLQSIISAPDKKISALNMLSIEETLQLKEYSEKEEIGYPEDLTIVDLFAKQAKERADELAVVYEGQSVSYKELDIRSNQLAHYLIKHGVQEESLVGICLDRSIDMVVGILGIIKAGGVYVPMDPTYPVERLEYMTKDSGLQFLICTQTTAACFENKPDVLILMDEESGNIDQEQKDLPKTNLKPENGLYVIYTSGSTGKPKGVVIEHRNVVRLFKTDAPLFDFGSEDVWTLFHSFCFDFSVWEMYGALLFGGRLVVVPTEVTRDAAAYSELLQTEGVTVLNQTPSSFYGIQDYFTEKFETTAIRYVIFGGEALAPAKVSSWKNTYPQCQMINMYGITETTVHVTYQEITTAEIESGISCIGRAIPTLNCYVLSPQMNQVPEGKTGEIYVGGAGLSRGYLNRPELTAERFIPNPFSNNPEDRLYKTGDLGRWLAGGGMEYMGRIDDQVKIRGYRIELGEVSAALENCSLVKQGVVLAKEDNLGDKQLVAYVVAENVFNKEEIQNYLKSKLPKFMVPAVIIEVEAFALTVNGKLDTNALPEANLSRDTYSAPRNEVEVRIVKIWQDLLKVEAVGIQDDFFELGGHSLLATRVASSIRKEFQVKVGTQDIFMNPTIEELAEIVAEQEPQSEKIEIVAIAEKPNRIPLSYAQERLWFIDQMSGSSNYHIPITHTFNKDLNVEALGNAIRKLMDRHEALRTVIREESGMAYQEVLAAKEWKLDFEEVNESVDISDLITEKMKAPIDLANDFMLQAKVYKDHQSNYTLLMVIHHISADGWSINILTNELLELYNAAINGTSDSLSPLNIQYSDYSIWQRNYLSGEVLDQKLSYWENQLKGLTHLELPLDFTRPSVQSTQGNSVKIRIPQLVTDALKKVAQEEGVTNFMCLLAGFKLLLHRYSNQTDICVGSSIANRESKELESLIGFFVNLITLRSDLSKAENFSDLLQQIKQTTLEAYAHQDAPFEKVVERIIEERDGSMSPLFQVSFALQNAPRDIQTEELPEMISADQLPKKEEDTSTSVMFDLAMNVFEMGEALSLELVYCTDLFKAETVERMCKNYVELLEQIANDKTRALGDFNVLSIDEKQQLEGFNNTEAKYPSETSVGNIFAAQVQQYPNETAVVFENTKLTYSELDLQSNAYAIDLIQSGVKPGDMVGICMDRSLEMVSGVLGILKAGAVYVPIDADYPAERIQFMVDDANLKFVLCRKGEVISTLTSIQDLQIIYVDAVSRSDDAKGVLLDVEVNAKDPAYLIYTSGSTGNPKGVLVSHQAILRLVYNDDLGFLNTDTVLYQYAPLSFDASTFEIWGALLKGGKVVVPTAGTKSLQEIEDDFRKNEVNTIFLTTGLFHLAMDTQPGMFEPIRNLLSGGESVHTFMIEKVLNLHPELTFFNCYGPTESTTFATIREINNAEEITSLANIIGKPIGNTKAFILSPDGVDLQAIGCPGELCLAGPGLALEYLGNVDLTNEKFIPNPYDGGDYNQLYRTGDIARWTAEGMIEFLGRKDNQVKVRGYRIELGEIERTLGSCEYVAQNIVLVKEDHTGIKSLIAYVVPNGNFNQPEIQQYLKSKLPEFMLPSVMVSLEAFPLTENGKVDRASLPEVDLSDLTQTDFVLPQNALQKQLAQIWKTLLKVEQIGIYDNFFEIGGHSLLAIRLLAAIREDLGMEVKIKDVFTNATIDKLSNFIETKAIETVLPAIVKAERPECLPVSYAQERLWFIDQLAGSTHYHISFVQPFGLDLDQSKMEKAFLSVIDRHEILRTVIVEKQGLPYQQVCSSDIWNFDFELIDNTILFDQKVQEDIERPFDLSSESPLRAKLYEVKDKGYVLVMVLHHIAADGWSSDILINELLECYQANLNQRIPNLEELKIQYADYAIWQRKHLEGEELDKQLNYWENKLAGTANLALPIDYPRPAIQSTRGSHIAFDIDKDLSQQLNDLCKDQGVTLFMLLLSAFKILLYKYTGQADICVGSPTANRNQKELEQLIGLFVNTIALRSDLSDQPSFLDLLQQVKTTTLDAYQHQETPFEKIVERIVGERDMSRSPLFQVMFMLQNMPNDLALDNGEESIADQNLSNQFFGLSSEAGSQAVAKFDLTMSAIEVNDTIHLTLEYCIDLFDASAIERMASNFKTLLQAIVSQPEQRIDHLSLMSKTAQKQLLTNFNPAESTYPSDKTIIDLFKETVETNKEETAIVFGSQEMSYGDLNQCSDQLSAYLIKQGIKEKDMVGISMERSLEMIISILAILKTGAAYVPVDPDYPASRQSFIAEDAGIKVFLTTGKDVIKSLQDDTQIIVVDEKLLKTIEAEKAPQSSYTSRDLSYVIYTSGSTGTPKGCMIEHRNVVNEITAQIKEFGIQKEDRILLASNITFDASVEQMFLALLSGAGLYVIDKASLLDSEKLSAYVVDHKITHVHMVPSLLDTMLERSYPDLRRVISGGDVCPISLAQKWSKVCDFYNEYGPTETTITSIETKYDGQEVNGSLPIGKPIANTQVYILDQDQNIAPIGVYGEICIGGAGVVRGYLNRPDLTAERFIELPFDPGNKIYRTGDLGRWSADGQIEFRGRNDSQVKVRGYRIELGEIEAVLNSIDAVQQGVVVANESTTGKMLSAYIVPKESFDKSSIQASLKRALPEYMVPALMIEMESLPLNSNGKIDRKALAELEIEDLLLDQYVAPSDELENRLVEIWSSLLNREKIGVCDNFFELGGHSLLGMRVLSEIQTALQVTVKIKDLFLNPTIREIAAFIKNTTEHTALPSIQLIENKPKQIPLSFAQERLWFIDQLNGSTQYHMSFVYRFDNDINTDVLSSAYNAIINRHDVLRTVFYNEGGIPYQKLLPQDKWTMDFESVDQSTKAMDLSKRVEAYVQAPFDLSNDHVVRAKVFDLGTEGYLLVNVLHHIASDAWSQNILTNELLELYHSKMENRAPVLKALPIQYNDYSLWQRNYLKGEVLEQKLAYWENKLKGFTHLNLPLDYSRPNIQSTRGKIINIQIEQELTEKLNALCQEQGVTLYMLFLTVFNLVLSRYTGQTDICIGSSTANRDQKEVENLIGFFANLMAVRNDLSGNPRFVDLLSSIRSNMLEAYSHQDTPFEKVVDRVIKERDRSMSPIFQVSLVLQNAPSETQGRDQDQNKLVPKSVNDGNKDEVVTSLFDLSLNVVELNQCLSLDLVYCVDLFKAETIQLMGEHINELLKGIVANPSQQINAYNLLSEKEQQRLESFNNTETAYPSNESVVSVFKKQVQAYPNHTALVCEDIVLNYAELDQQSDVIAIQLVKAGVQSGDLVGICIDRSPEMIPCVLGILKSGAAYVPIDPEYPRERIQFIIDDAQLQFILCSAKNIVTLMEVEGPQLILADTEDQSDLENAATIIPQTVDALDPAYLIYTSGSTGKPKGVLIKHQSILRLLFNDSFEFLNENTILYQYAPLSFDASTFEVWGPLLNGGQIFMPTAGTKSLQQIEDDFRKQKINTAWLTAGLFHLAAETRPELFAPIKFLLAGGESIHLSMVEKVLTLHSELTFINGYGPTESTTFAVMRSIENVNDISSSANIIGQPIGNTKAYILSPQGLEIAPIGCPGELCLAGPGLALKYLHNAELTAEKFVPNPYNDGDYDRLYRTGDLARWLGDGTIEFLGRKDNQVKIRGYRIELGEIERTLDQCDLIAQNVVLALADDIGTQKLVTYIIPVGDFDQKAIQSFLKSKLPDYMIPNVMVPVESFALTENGKVDRKALPDVDLSALVQTDFVPAQTPLQEQLTQIWKPLLKLEQIGIHDNFFDLGGHSLLAIRLLAAIREDLGLEVKITNIFEHATIDRLSTFIENEATESNQVAVVKSKRPEWIPASFSQERLWFIDRLTGSTHYHIPFIQPFDLDLDRSAMENAFCSIIDRHEILRTVFIEQEGLPYQKILSADTWNFDFELIESAETFDQKVQQDIQRPFDLSCEHPIRVKLYEVKDKGYILVMVLHHIATDGWSNDILINELLECYQANLNQRIPNLEELKIQYADYALWQRNYLEGEVLDDQLTYWENKLEGVSNLSLPLDYPRPAIQSIKGAHVGFDIDKALSQQLNDLCKDQGVTLFMLLLSAFKTLLYKYTGQTDICVGSPTANRNQKELEELIGLFVNTIALRSDLSDQPSFLDLLQQVKTTTLDAYQHQETPFEKIVDSLVGERDLSRSPLFQVMFMLQNMPNELVLNNDENGAANQRISKESLGIASEADNPAVAKFDLTMSAIEINDGIHLNLEYCIDLFDASTIERMASHFKVLLQAIVAQPGQSLDQLSLMNAIEEEKLLVGFNPAESAYPSDKTLIDLFKEQVAVNRDEVAMFFETREMTYGDLDRYSDQLSVYLSKSGVKERDLVGLCMERSPEMVISILAILKTGAAYVAIAPDYPVSRQRFIAKDAGINVLLTNAGNVVDFVESDTEVIEVEESLLERIESEQVLDFTYNSSDLAYIIYTSGTTGTPKGCMVEHRNVVNEITSQIKEFGIEKEDRILLASNISFDASVEQMFLALLGGASLYVITKSSLLDANALSAYVVENKISHIHMVPSLLDTMLERSYPDLRRVISGGDVCPISLAQKWSKVCDFYNEYGPTETTITSIEVKYEGDEIRGSLPIGQPIGNTQVYILDRDQNIAPIGVYGEICIGGAGVTRGYLNRPELTSERFISLPFHSGAKVYRTGDVGRWRADGQIEFRGRNDSQVKVRGYRIELGEIETVLNSIDSVQQGVVVAKESTTGKMLSAYIVPKESFDKSSIQASLKRELPEYMVPALMIEMESLPLNSNGKIDRKALVDLEMEDLLLDQYVAPSNEMESRLVEIWSDLLNREKIGVCDNFFELGGHSLLANQLVASLQEAFDLKIPLLAIFEFSTIKELAQYIHLIDDNDSEQDSEETVVFEL